MHLNDNIHNKFSAISKITLFQALEENRTDEPLVTKAKRLKFPLFLQKMSLCRCARLL
jgi:hypothetical protein